MIDELPTGADVARFLGRASDTEFVKLADQHVPLVTSFIRAYTRGRGFDDDSEEVEEDVRAVIITATARLVVNPAQVSRESVDGYSAVGSLKRLHVARAGRAAPVSTANDVRNAPHRFELIRRVTVSMIDGSPGYDWETYAIVPGWFSFLDAEELAVWESQHVTASARIPSSSIAVTTTDRVRVINPPETALEGPWQISTIRYNGVHLRLMLRR